MADIVIDGLLAILVMSLLFALIKFGGALIAFVGGKAKNRLDEARQKVLSRKYPLQSDRFPTHALSFGDLIELKEGVTAKYHGKPEGMYYIEAENGGLIEGERYRYVTEDFLREKAVKLFTPNVIKWAGS